MLCATSFALFLSSAEVHLRQMTLQLFLRSLLQSVEESRAASAKWGLALYASGLCGREERPPRRRTDSSKTLLACCFQGFLLNREPSSAALTGCSC